ncbi:MAG: phage major capsid protein [Oscillospiraceae bacterium]|nr:phage major capsid protein [Oscillospiraceae bacterium]
MATKTTSGTLFKPELVTELFNKVKGHSSLAKLCGGSPMPFAGTDTFVFTMDGEAAIVGEGAQKPAGDAAFTPVTIKPIKFVYQHRVTDEFIRLSEEKQIPYLRAYADGFAKKIARGMDIAAMHGVNPATGSSSAIVGTNSFQGTVTDAGHIITYNSSTPDDNIDAAVGAVQTSDGIVTGIAMAPAMGAAIGAMKMTDSGAAMYPEFRFGGNPAAFGALASDINSTVAFGANQKLRAIVGDFANAFKWGYAENITLEVIQYGDPDGQGDLKRTNEIVLRSEVYIGWGILDANSFALIKVNP